MDSFSEIGQLLKVHGIRLKKDLGQNFLVEDVYIRRIVEFAAVGRDDEVLEIGAGIGSLTYHLALAARQVCAVEIDAQLFPLLEERMQLMTNVILIEGNVMDIPIQDMVSRPGYKVVANIPYYLTSNLIRYLLEASMKPALLTLTLQKEVAERICAGAGELSLLALSVQVYGSPRIVQKIPAGAFFPPPKVDSATLVVEIFDQPVIPSEKLDVFFRLIKAAFSQKRKMLHNTLSAGLNMESTQLQGLLKQADIDSRRRAQTVSLTEWHRLTDIFSNA